MAAITLPAHAGAPVRYQSLVTSQAPQSIRLGLGIMHGFFANNNAAAARFLKLYDKATAPVIGTDAPFLVVPLAAAPGVASLQLAQGISFQLGLGASLALTFADSDTTTAGLAASDIVATFVVT